MPFPLTLDQRTQETSSYLGRLVVSTHHCSIKLIAFIIATKLLASVHKNEYYINRSVVTKSHNELQYENILFFLLVRFFINDGAHRK